MFIAAILLFVLCISILAGSMAEYSLDSNGIFLFIVLSLFIFSLKKLIKSEAPPLPPGPPSWPIFSAIAHLRHPITDHLSLASLAQTYGPLLHIKLGGRHLIVGSSPEAAAAILKANDRLLSGRGVPHVVPKTPAQIEKLSFWADSTSDSWRNLRAVCRAELFSAKALQGSARVREEKEAALVAELRSREGAAADVGKMVFDTVVNMSSNAYFSEDVAVGFGENRMAGILKEILEAFGSPNLSDLYPIMGGLDPQGLRRKYMKCSKKMWGIWEPIVRERRKVEVSELRNQDFLDIVISKGFGDDQINHLLEDLFSGGIHTTTLTIIKTMTELLATPHSITKLRQELDAAFDGRDPIMSSAVDGLPYLEACIKETLRLHPPAPLMLNHRAYEACRVMSYTVPKDALIIVNVWAIGRDPAAWEEPLRYWPERFLASSLNFKGNDFEFLPFGAGRRICPGMNMADKIVALVVASLVYRYDWSAPSSPIEGALVLVPRARK